MNFCSDCAGPLAALRDGVRGAVCLACGEVHRDSPKILVGCIAGWDDRVLLCRRGIEPAYGKWTFPGGFLENGETVAAGIEREVREETGARIELGGVFSIVSVPQIGQVYVVYRARLIDLALAPGPETLQIALFDLGNIPWKAIAFAATELTLRRFCEDRARGWYGLHEITATVEDGAIGARGFAKEVRATRRPPETPPPRAVIDSPYLSDGQEERISNE